jgi:ATP-dependent DNA helicase RecG
MQSMDLLALLKSPEGKTLEFKRDLSSPENVLRTAIAFANTSGGTILIGVDDRTRNVRGVSDPLEVEERLANLISDTIAPRLVPELEILPWRRKYVVALQFHPSGSRPHHLKSLGPESGVFVRVGSTNRLADREFIEELRRFSRNESYDERPMPELDLETIDFKGASAERTAGISPTARKSMHRLSPRSTKRSLSSASTSPRHRL